MLLRMCFKPRMDIRPICKQWLRWISRQPKMNVTILDEPVKSEGDRKLYRAIGLSNGVRAVLISDPGQGESSSTTLAQGSQQPLSATAESSSASLEHFKGRLAACAVQISVGSFYEPQEYQGLAHFLEHMIFMGSRKYPKENAFDSFIAKSGGFSNAHTENEDTTFYFEVEDSAFDKSLDMFMNLMKDPLMLHDSMTRERSAVQSEFEQTHMVDEVRRDQLMASMATKGYPHATFSWGNHKSLQENVNDTLLHKALHELRRNHYGANRMTVCLQAQVSLDELQELLVRHCADIPSSMEPLLDFSQFNYTNAFREQFFRDVLLVQPVEDVCKVEITWVLPPMRQFYRSKPEVFMAHMLGHEGVGSLCAYLRRRLWCMSIMAGVGNSSFETNSIYSLFTMCIYLTDEGFQNLDEVMAATFFWIRMLNECATLHGSYKEIQQIADTNFRFEFELPAMDNVQSIVESMKFMPPKDVLAGPQLYFDYDEPAMELLRQHLSLFHFNIMISSHIPYEDYEYDQKERWFGTHYKSIEMPAKWRDFWINPIIQPELTLPVENPFVTTDFTLHWKEAGKPHVPRRPKPIIKNEICELWFRQDDTFLLPDGCINLYLITPVMRRSARECMAAVLFTYLVEFYIAEQLYPALLAGLTYGLDTADKGLVLRVSGYNQKLPYLIEIIMHVMKTLEIDEAQLESFRELKKRQIFNSIIGGQTLNLDLRLTVLEYMRFTLLQKYEALQQITVEDVKDFQNNFYKQLYVQALIQGNFTEKHALDVMHKVFETYPCEKIENLAEQHNRLVQLPLGTRFLRVKNLNEDDTNTVVSNYYQLGPSSIQLESLMDLIELIVEEPYFNQLRTQEQLCYSLGIYQRIGYGILACILNVNSQETKFTAEYVEQRMEAFRLQVPEIISKLSDVEFEKMRETLISGKKLGDHNLDDEVQRNWSEIVTMDYFFNRTELQIQTIKTLKRKDLIDFLTDYNSNRLRKLSVQVIGSSSSASRVSHTHSIAEAMASGQFASDLDRRPGSLNLLLDEVQRSISDEQILFEQIGDSIKLDFIVDNESDIPSIEDFKKDLYVYPLIQTNPKLNNKS